MDDIKKEVIQIEERNARVEAEKEWETSITRVGLVCVFTYIATATVFATIGEKDYLINAFIPTTAFFVSTLSLPPVKRWWIRRYIGDINRNRK